MQLVGAREGRLRRRDGAAADPGDVPLRALRTPPGLHRRDAGRRRREGRQGGRLPPRPRDDVGAAARRRHRRVARAHAGRPGRRVALRRRSSSTPRTSTRGWSRTAWRSTPRRCAPAFDERVATVLDAGHADRAPRSRPRPAAGGAACTPRRWAAARRDAAPGPLAPGGDVVTATRHGRWDDRRRRCSTPRCRCSPSRTSASCARSTRTSRRRATCTITPTYSGCPAMDTIRDDIVAAFARRRPRRRTRRVRAGPGLDHRLDERRGQGQAAGLRHRAAAAAGRAAACRCRCPCAARSAARPTPAS